MTLAKEKIFVYFIVNFHGIRSFLSIINPQARNLIVVGSEESATHSFLKKFMPECEFLLIQDLRLDAEGGLRTVLSNARRFWTARRMAKSFLRGLAVEMSVCLFSRVFPAGYYTWIFQALRRAKVKTYIPSMEGFYYLRRNRPIPWRMHVARLAYSLAAGGPLDFYSDSTGVPIPCISRLPARHEIAILGWTEIRQKFKFNSEFRESNAILIIDTPVQVLEGIDLESSQKNLSAFFKEKLDSGKKIHVKPHYYRPETHSLQGTEVASHVKVLPAVFPIELIMDEYSEVYAFTSAALAAPNSVKKFSLLNLLDIEDESIRKRLHEDALFGAGENRSALIFVEPSKK